MINQLGRNMRHLIGIVSDAYIGNNEFGIDFETFQKNGIESLDYQDLMCLHGDPDLNHMPMTELEAYLTRLYRETRKYNLVINQLHALWDSTFKNEGEYDMFDYYDRAIYAASILKTKFVVIHPIPLKGHYLWEKVDYDKIVKTNKELINRLLPSARKYNIYIAVENLPFVGLGEFFSPSGTLKFVEEINHPNVVMCLDTGHFNMFGEEKIYDFILKAGSKIGCLHIHDNKGSTDSHSIPRLGTFDWEMFIKGLKKVGFAGVLSLETKILPDGLSEKAYKLLNDSLITIITDMRDELDK